MFKVLYLKKGIKKVCQGVLVASAFLLGTGLSSPSYAQQYDAKTLEALRELESQINVEDYFDSETVEKIKKLKETPEDPDEIEVAKASEGKTPDNYIVVEKNYAAGSVPAQMQAAKRAVDLGRYDAAQEIYESLLQSAPEDVDALIGYASILQRQGQDDMAVNIYEQALKVDPDNLDAHINMLGVIGESYPAVALQRLLALQEKLGDFNATLVGQIAFVQARLGRYTEAMQSYGMISAHEPHNPQHLLNMAIVADRASNHKDAVRYYEEALNIDTIYFGGRALDRSSIFDRLAQLR